MTVDYDLQACLDCNPQSFLKKDIKEVLAVWEGENDEDDWRWILQLKDERFVFLQGGCDYTGWDCQSWATSQFADNPEDAAKYALGDFKLKEDESPMNAGLGHMINILSGSYMNNAQEVYNSLVEQLQKGKKKTWTELKEDEFGGYERL